MTGRRNPLVSWPFVTWLARGITAPLLIAAFGLAFYSLISGSAYSLRLMTLAGIYALMVMGYQLVFGHAGALSLAQGTFFGLGAYVTGILGSRLGWGFAATFPLSILLPVLLAILVAVPVLRLKSHYFALATLGIGQVVLLIAVSWEEVTGGANGLSSVPGIVLFGYAAPHGLTLLAAIWAIVALGGIFAWLATRGTWGQAFLVLRESPLAAAAIGLDGGALRLAAFLLSAGYAGSAGALYAHTIGVISPEVLGFPVMILCLTMAMVGGRARIAGAIVGAVLLVHLPEWLRFLGSAYLIAYGVALLGFVILAPDGVVGVLDRLRNSLFPAASSEPSPTQSPAPRPLSAEARGPKLAVSGVGKRFGGIEALVGVGFDLAPGEILGLIGPNGSGKTTLLNLITGLDHPDSGTIRFGDIDIPGLLPHRIARLGIARTFQAGNLVEPMSALDTVTMAFLAAQGRVSLRRALAEWRNDAPLAAAHSEAMRGLASLGVEAHAGHACVNLPHSARRRVEIARALAVQPHILLLDEPAAGLTMPEQADLADRLAGLAKGGLGILVIEHNMGFLMPLAHRVICLDRGRIIASGTPDQIGRDRRVIAAYLGEPVVERGEDLANP
jgi:branched-chain amino acid transport system permease protein